MHAAMFIFSTLVAEKHKIAEDSSGLPSKIHFYTAVRLRKKRDTVRWRVTVIQGHQWYQSKARMRFLFNG